MENQQVQSSLKKRKMFKLKFCPMWCWKKRSGTKPIQPNLPVLKKNRYPEPTIPLTAEFLDYHRDKHAYLRRKIKFQPKLDVIHEADEDFDVILEDGEDIYEQDMLNLKRKLEFQPEGEHIKADDVLEDCSLKKRKKFKIKFCPIRFWKKRSGSKPKQPNLPVLKKIRYPEPTFPLTTHFLDYHREKHAKLRRKIKFQPSLDVILETDEDLSEHEKLNLKHELEFQPEGEHAKLDDVFEVEDLSEYELPSLRRVEYKQVCVNKHEYLRRKIEFQPKLDVILEADEDLDEHELCNLNNELEFQPEEEHMQLDDITRTQNLQVLSEHEMPNLRHELEFQQLGDHIKHDDVLEDLSENKTLDLRSELELDPEPLKLGENGTNEDWKKHDGVLDESSEHKTLDFRRELELDSEQLILGENSIGEDSTKHNDVLEDLSEHKTPNVRSELELDPEPLTLYKNSMDEDSMKQRDLPFPKKKLKNLKKMFKK